MKNSFLYSILLSCFLICSFGGSALGDHQGIREMPLSEHTRNNLKRVIHSFQDQPECTLGGEAVLAPHMLENFYGRRNFQPAWSNDNGITPLAEILIEKIEHSSVEGLVPEHYHFERIMALYNLMQAISEVTVKSKAESLAEMDILLTDAFLMLGCRFSAGCINPLTVEAEWHASRFDLRMEEVLADALKEDAVLESLYELLPGQPEYYRLRKALQTYRTFMSRGGLPAIETSSLFQKGENDDYIIPIKKLLLATGDLSDEAGPLNRTFNESLEKAVKIFQKRHGIEPDGIIGPHTLQSMNVSVETRIHQIEVNLERMRWIARNLGHRYIIVNIADFTLRVVEYGQTVMSTDVIVGKPYRNTPVFTEKMEYMVFNPSWYIPERIVAEEILPMAKRNPNYIKENNFIVRAGWNQEAAVINPETINWPQVTPETFHYTLMQPPGPLNPLGRIKFMFPNRFNVYIHDTPAREKFSSTIRTFSHGCIRIKDPVDLAEYLMQDDPDWTLERINALIKSGIETKIQLTRPIAVHIIYLTAWVDDQGILQFRQDIYGRDALLARALSQSPPQFH